MLTVTLPNKSHWLVIDGSTIGGEVCLGPCNSYVADRVAPVQMADGGAVYTADALSPLCKWCSLGESNRLRAGWSLRQADVVELWVLVRRAQAEEPARKAAREAAVATTLDELQQASTRALEQARTNACVFGYLATSWFRSRG